MFFPDADEDSKPANRSPWSIFWTKPGYVWEYHELLKNCGPSEGFDIRKQLGKIFSLVETLPDSVKGSTKMPGKTWRLEEDKVVLIKNLKLYKIKGIWEEKERKQGRKKGVRVLKARKKLEKDLLEHAGYEEVVARKELGIGKRRVEEERKRKSGKVRNGGKAPMKKEESTIEKKGKEKEGGKIGGEIEEDNEDEKTEEEEEEEEEEEFTDDKE